MSETPLLDEIEFTKLCEDIIEAFNTPYLDERIVLDMGTPREGCFTAILGPANVPGFPVWADGRYDALTVTEARMLATIVRERLGLIWDPERRLHAWAEVATSRFLVSSRTDEIVTPGPYPAGGSP